VLNEGQAQWLNRKTGETVRLLTEALEPKGR
jgi:hypothetical protein